MTPTPRLLAGGLAVCALLWGTAAHAAIYSVSGSPPAPSASEIIINVDLGEPGQTAATIGPIPTTGSADATVVVSAEGAGPWMPGAGDGSVTFNSSAFFLDDTLTTVDLGFFGTVDASTNGVAFSITSTAIPVVGNEWNLDTIGAPTALSLSLNQGSILLDNPTGILAGIITEPIVLDFDAEPLTLELADLLGLGLGGTADSTTIGIAIPAIANEVLDDPILVFAVLSGDVFLQVPEPGSIALLATGLIGLVLAGVRHRRRS